MADKMTVVNIRQNTKMKKAINFRFIFASFFMVVFFVLLFFIICGMFFFKVKNVKINGNLYYDAEEIVRKSGIAEGGAIFMVNKQEASDKIKENFPYIKDLTIKTVFPNTVKIDVENDEGVYKIKLGGEYYIISSDFKVLCKENSTKRDSDGEEYENNIITVKTDAAVKCFVGKTIVFSDIDVKDILTLFYESFKENEIFDYINEIDITDKFNIYLIYSNRFRIEYGNFEYVGIKTQLAHHIIERLFDDDMGIIDVKDKKEGVYIYKKNIY